MAPRQPPLTVEEAADYLSTTVRHMRRLVSQKKVTSIKVSGKLRFDRRDLDDFLDKGRRPAAS